MKLKQIYSTIIYPKAPYNFNYSVYNPSHYTTQLVYWEPGKIWFTERLRNQLLGLKLEGKGSVDKPKVKLTVYGTEILQSNFKKKLLVHLDEMFEFGADYSEFYNKFKDDDKLRAVLKKFRGMRIFCIENLYEYIMITILIQNTHIKRAAKMTQAMFDNYGDLLEFDSKKLYCFWEPKHLINVSEQELRDLKVGYRAKMFLRVSGAFASGKVNEDELKRLSDIELRKELLKIYSVGPASVDYLMRDVFHRQNALNIIPPWEAKVYSRLLGLKTTEPEDILTAIHKRYGEWRGLAMHYLFMDISWRHKHGERIDWMEKLLPF